MTSDPRRPPCRSLHRGARGARRARLRLHAFVLRGHALVEDHRDVGAELRLNVGRLLGRQRAQRAVEVRAELDAILRHPPHRRQTEDLVPAAVGEQRMRPTDERVQPARAGDEIIARTQVQVIRVAEDDLGAEGLEVAVGDGLHRAARAHRHERRRLHDSVRRRQHAAPRGPIRVRDLELHWYCILAE
jgi:hypothetical protein